MFREMGMWSTCAGGRGTGGCSRGVQGGRHVVQVLKGKSVCRGMERSSKHAVHVTLAALGQPRRLCKTRLAVVAFLRQPAQHGGVQAS